MGGRRGLTLPLILKSLAKKGCFRGSHWEKTIFTTFGPPGKILIKFPSGPPRKDPSDAHGRINICVKQYA